MRIAYLCSWSIGRDDGVTHKILDQVSAWRGLGHEVRVFAVVVERAPSVLDAEQFPLGDGSLPAKFRGPHGLRDAIDSYAPDLVYLRHELYKPYLGRLMERTPTVIELNTDDVRELRLVAHRSPRDFANWLYNRVSRPFLFSRARGLVTVTEEIAQRSSVTRFALPTVTVPNCIHLDRFRIVKTGNAQGPIRFFFMGTPSQPWHGVDKIERLAAACGEGFEFDIVGPDRPHSAPGNVHYHGYLARREYEQVLARCHVCLGTLAFHRQGMNHACPLKVREYVACGFPVVVGYLDTAFAGCCPDWVLRIANEEHNVTKSMAEILEFARRMRDRVVEHAESRPFVDFPAKEAQRLAFLESAARRTAR